MKQPNSDESGNHWKPEVFQSKVDGFLLALKLTPPIKSDQHETAQQFLIFSLNDDRLQTENFLSLKQMFILQALHKIITPLPPDDPKAAALHQQMHPSVLQQLIMSNFQTTQLHPCVTMEHVMQLKNIINDTLEAATNFEGSSNMDQKPNQGRVGQIQLYLMLFILDELFVQYA